MAVGWGCVSTSTISCVSCTEKFSSAVTTCPNEITYVQVEVDFCCTPGGDATISIYATPDAACQNWDDTALQAFDIANCCDPNAVSLTMFGVYSFRVGAKAKCGCDTFPSVTVDHRVGTMS